ncbi:MAG: hypothetical protein HY722_13755 [Planctomycetes bacterium]|nr:hypothetical protein [Planctomycetota bacterium]
MAALVSTTDNAGQTMRQFYDSRGLAIARTDGNGPPIADPLGLCTAGPINAHGNVTRMFYDGIQHTTATELLLQAGGLGDGAAHLLDEPAQEAVLRTERGRGRGSCPCS